MPKYLLYPAYVSRMIYPYDDDDIYTRYFPISVGETVVYSSSVTLNVSSFAEYVLYFTFTSHCFDNSTLKLCGYPSYFTDWTLSDVTLTAFADIDIYKSHSPIL